MADSGSASPASGGCQSVQTWLLLAENLPRLGTQCGFMMMNAGDLIKQGLQFLHHATTPLESNGTMMHLSLIHISVDAVWHRRQYAQTVPSHLAVIANQGTNQAIASLFVFGWFGSISGSL